MNLRLLLDKKNWKKLLFVYRHNKNNESMESSYNENDAAQKVYGFYHAYCMCNHWEMLVKEQLEHIKSSGLYDRMDKLYMGVLIEERSIPLLRSIIKKAGKIEVLYTGCDRTLFEFPTLIKMQEKCKEEDFIGFYFHTKGISWFNKPEVYNIGNSWRIMAEYFMFDRYKMAIHALYGGYDVYGTNYQEIFNDEFRIIGGNFFWFRSEYVKNLYTLKTNRYDRNESEKWILTNTHNVYCPFFFSGNTRNDAIPYELYMPINNKFVRYYKASFIYFSRFSFLIRRLLGLKVNLINPNGKINKQ